jgi:CRP/FNR family transcriptional regulator
VKIVISNPDGKETILSLIDEGNIFGQSSLFSGEHYNAAAIAIEDSIINFYKKDFILDLTKKHPSIALKFLAQISHSMGNTENYKAVLIHKNVRERLAGLLISLQATFGVESDCIGSCIRINIILTREEMAGLIGTTIETLVRLITEFKNEEIISQSGKYICIVNQKKLLAFANL